MLAVGGWTRVVCLIGDLVILPKILDVGLCQLLVGAVRLLPFLKPAAQHADFLCDGRRRSLLVGLVLLLRRVVAPLGPLDRGGAVLAFAGADVFQGGAGPALLGEGAVEDDRVCGLELSEEGGQPFVELVRGDPSGALDVAADVVCSVSSAHAQEGEGSMGRCVPPSRTSMTAIELLLLSVVLGARSCSARAAASRRGRLATVNLDMARWRVVVFMGAGVQCCWCKVQTFSSFLLSRAESGLATANVLAGSSPQPSRGYFSTLELGPDVTTTTTHQLLHPVQPLFTPFPPRRPARPPAWPRSSAQSTRGSCAAR